MALVALTALGSLGLTACGGSSAPTSNGEAAKSATQILADAAAWKVLFGGGSSATAAATELADQWLQTTTTNASFGSLAVFVDVSTLTAQLGKPAGKVSKGRTTTFDSKAAIPLLNDHAGTGSTLYVAATGKPYILGLTNTQAKQRGKLTFSNFGKAAAPAVPSGSISLSKLEAAGNP